MGLDDAKAAGAMALFGEKYGEQVRVVTMGSKVDEKPFSLELCGGTHVLRTGDLGAFAIVSESGIAAGVRRIEALTGAAASAWLAANSQTVNTLASMVKSGRELVTDKVQDLMDRNRQLERELAQLKVKLAAAQGADLLGEAEQINGVNVLVTELQGVEPKALRDTMDQLRNKLGSGVVLLAVKADDKASIVAGVTQDITGRIKAGDLIRYTAGQMNGKGGGRPDMAQGGGDASMLAAALQSVKPWLQENLV